MKYDVIRSLKGVLILVNSVDPDEMQHYILICTVCQSSARLGVSSVQRVKHKCIYLIRLLV